MNYSDFNKVNGIQSRNTNKYSAPVDFNVGNGVMGSYDNIKFNTQCITNDNGWKAPPCNPPVKNARLFVPQGTPLPLKSETIYAELPTDSMFMFSKTFASPDCSSTYSTDRGQLCLSGNEQKYIGEMRGYNKTYSNYDF
jgi:hypothetical protein